MKLKAIAAMASNRVIGQQGELPWHLPEDFRWFKKLTMGHPVVMGRKTCESIGKALPGRRNIVISRQWTQAPKGFELVDSVEAVNALDLRGEVFLLGGAMLYEKMLPQCEELYLSYVFEAYQGDAYFPAFEDRFDLAEVVASYPEFELRRYVRNLSK
ncbi:MAG: dihydrofolate reductase [Verrucomicrobiales bacterium]|nr:dihydrofolate reductase [Verrucomicrobiales bacterium]